MKRISILDFETSYQVIDKKKDPSPYNPYNFIVSYGLKCKGFPRQNVGYNKANPEFDYDYYKCLRHNQQKTDQDGYDQLKYLIEQTDILVAFNAKFELSWLKAIDIEYTGKIFDPMIAAYVLARGQKWSMSLEELCKRYKVELKKSDLVAQYMKDNVSFENIPWEIIEEYGRGDVISTWQLYLKLKEELDKEENKHLWATVDLMHEFCLVLTDMEFSGIHIDTKILQTIEDKYRIEYNDLEVKLRRIAQEAWGDAPINIHSPEQLSQLLYSRKVNDKKKWKEIFNIGTELRGSVRKPKYPPKMKPKEFVDVIQANTSIVYKTISRICDSCNENESSNLESLAASNLSLWKRKCRDCLGTKLRYDILPRIAGFKFSPKTTQDVSANGFATDKESIERLKQIAKGSAKDFLEAYTRYNAIDTYLNTFVEGIKRGLIDEYIHTSFMQCVTATGRLSSRNPNFQNMPRGNTFEVKQAITSRFLNGVITEADARQLEFRIAGELSGDQQILEDVISGVDVHANTAKATGLSRQDSKQHTFAPVYGAVATGKDAHIAAYYNFFTEHYRGLSEAQSQWAEMVVASDGLFRLPSGREYYYPNTKRFFNGGISNSTIIKNYPVQGHATGDLIPVWCIEVWKKIKSLNLKSILFLTVHDSVVVDSPPEEKDIIVQALISAWESATKEQPKIRWNYEYKISLEIEIKQGLNWLEMKELKL